MNEDPRPRDTADADQPRIRDLFANQGYKIAPDFPVKLSMPDPLPATYRVLGACTIMRPEEHNGEDLAIILDVEISLLGIPEDSSLETKERRCLAHVYGMATYRDGTYSNLRYSSAVVCKLLPPDRA